jgi:hypothetical protein
MHEAYVLSEVELGTQHRGARWGRTTYAKDNLLLVSVRLFPFRGEADIPNRELLNRELLQRTTDEATNDLFVGCSFTTDVMD